MSDENKNEVNGELLNLINLYQSKGENQLFLQLTLLDAEKETLNKQIIDYLKKQIDDQKEIDLTLDILDFIMDFCTNNDTIILISEKNFLDSIISLLKAYISSSTKEKILFLIKKWAEKFETTFPTFNEEYKKLKEEMFQFPDEEIVTYKKYFKNKIINEENYSGFNNNTDKFSLDNIEFPEDQFSNQFSNLRTSLILDCFKNSDLSRKNTMEKINIQNQNNNTKNDVNKDEKNNTNNKNSTNNDQNTDNQKNKINDNNIQNSAFEKYNNDPGLFENTWNEKIKDLNKYINEGVVYKYQETLKGGIKEFITELSKNEMEEIILKCAKIGDDKNRNMVSNIKSDMEQTCHRFECLMKDKKVEKFKSAFNGNLKKYIFNSETIFDEPENKEKKEQSDKGGKKKFSLSRNVKELFKVGKNKANKTQDYEMPDKEKKDTSKEKKKKEKEKEKKDKSKEKEKEKEKEKKEKKDKSKEKEKKDKKTKKTEKEIDKIGSIILDDDQK